MNIFIITAAAVFTAIAVETLLLYLEYKGKRLTAWFGKKGFTIHAVTTVFLWALAGVMFLILQFEPHPEFHNIAFLKAAGGIIALAGFAVSLWAFYLMGAKRSLGINFFREEVPVEERGIYRYLSNPEAAGLCWGFAGIALFTGSIYNLIIALEIIAIMIPHTIFENLPLKNKR